MIIQSKNIDIVDIDSLVLNPKNNNKHPKEQIERLAKLIKHHGFRNPLVVSNRSGFVISTFKYYDQELMAEIVSKPYIPNGSKANVKEAKKKDYLIPRPEFLALLKRLNNEDEIDL